MGGAAIARMADDEIAAWVMDSAALAVMLALLVDAILLIGVLGIKALMDTDRQQNEYQRREERKRMMMRHGGRGRRGRGGKRPRD